MDHAIKSQYLSKPILSFLGGETKTSLHRSYEY